MKRLTALLAIVLVAFAIGRGTAQTPTTKAITFRVPIAMYPMIVEAFAREYQYQDEIPDPDDPTQTITNPQSKEDFFLYQVIKFVATVAKDNTPSLDAAKAAEAAAKAAIDQAVEQTLQATTAETVDE